MDAPLLLTVNFVVHHLHFLTNPNIYKVKGLKYGYLKPRPTKVAFHFCSCWKKVDLLPQCCKLQTENDFYHGGLVAGRCDSRPHNLTATFGVRFPNTIWDHIKCVQLYVKHVCVFVCMHTCLRLAANLLCGSPPGQYKAEVTQPQGINSATQAAVVRCISCSVV